MEDNTPQSLESQRRLGLMPRWLYEEKRKGLGTPMEMLQADTERMYAIKAAMICYKEAGRELPEAWIHELQDIVEFRLYSSIFQN